MEKARLRSPIDEAAARLRDIALTSPQDTLLGSEDDLIRMLGVSRVTVRQAARLLEREGVLRVRRGINGGYFATRPSVEMVETVVSAYLNTLGLDTRHTGGVATALWMETMRQAAGTDRSAARALAEELSLSLEQIASDASIREVAKFETESRAAIFRLIEGTYIEVFFGINSAFSRQHVEAEMANIPATLTHRQHQTFVERWKRAKRMELEAMAEGDEMLAMMTALHTRKVWMSRADAWDATRSAPDAETT